MNLNNDNYFSPEAASEYWSVSRFKAFNKCEACGLAEARGEYQREETDALLIGSYVDAYFSGPAELDKFIAKNGDKMYSKRGGGLLAKFQQANTII
uniref:PD-(D/E)XK nuclease-like domain-containing protein n=1 Tax=Ruminococcus sp. TaxID=41978 RepID=UPI00388E338E